MTPETLKDLLKAVSDLKSIQNGIGWEHGWLHARKCLEVKNHPCVDASSAKYLAEQEQKYLVAQDKLFGLIDKIETEACTRGMTQAWEEVENFIKERSK